jgi:hypothetical protein
MPYEEGSGDTHEVSHMLSFLLSPVLTHVLCRRHSTTSAPAANTIRKSHPNRQPQGSIPNFPFFFLFSISHLGVPVLLKIFIFLGIKNW